MIAIVPLNPPTLAMLRVEVAFEPEMNPIVDGLAEKVKSMTLTVSWTL